MNPPPEYAWPPLSRDMPCAICQHAGHLIECGFKGCACTHPAVPGVHD